jgi:hypothetical protein
VATVWAFTAYVGYAIAAGPFEQHGNSRWIVYASRQNVDEAIGLARRMTPGPGPTKVMSTTNGWYAVTTGPLEVTDPDALKKKLATSWSTPHDAFLTIGQTFVEQVWQTPTSPVLATASTSENEPRSAAANGVDVALATEGTRYTIVVRAAGRKVSEITFDDAGEMTSVGAKIAKLDPTSPFPQVVVTHYIGGAHCCTDAIAVTFADGRWQKVNVGRFDGNGPSIEDLNSDGNAEFLTYDNSFLYAFGPYASSYAPPEILRLVGSHINNVTATPEFQRTIRQMLLAQQSLADPDMWHDNGFLGGWVAHKALVGEGADAWRQMLQSYNRNSDWSLTDCAVPPPPGAACPEADQRVIDFPTALKEHLASGGYNIAGLTESAPPAPPPAVAAPVPRASIVPPAAAPPAAATSSSVGESIVMLKRDGENFAVPVTINNTITLDFLVDSGASDVSIPADVILTLIRAGTIQSSDFVGTRTYRLADGSTVPSTTLIIHKLKVGDREVENVMAGVSDVKGSLLLGQSFFHAFDSWSIDNRRGALILKSGAPSANEVAAATAPPDSQNVVRAFYAALAASAGDQAASLIVPSKREAGPLSATAISSFYSRLEQPLELLAIESTGPDTYLVRYRYKAPRSAICNGRAIVTTTTVSGSTLISHINALDGC